MRRVFFVNRFYAPDHSATAQILSDLAVALVQRGHEVHIIASQGLYDDPAAKLPLEETLDGVIVHRVPVPAYDRNNLGKRAFGYLFVYRQLASALRKLIGAGDIVVAKTDPPLLSVVVERAIRGKGAVLINWLQDVYPEVAAHLGVPFVKGPVSNILARFRDRSLERAYKNVVLGVRMADVVRQRGVHSNKIAIIHNWTDDQEILPVPHSSNRLRNEWGLENKFVVGYSGNLGRAHEFDTLLEAARQLHDREDIVFLFIGSGHHFARLKALVDEFRIAKQFQFRPYQARKDLKNSLGVADVHWLSLRPELEGLIVPSKFYGIAAAGRPTIAVTVADGEIGRLVEEHECGVQVNPGDGAALAQTIKRLADDPSKVDEMGRRARSLIDTTYSRKRAVDQWDELLRSA
ncbi:glycosyltransferase family 4 protein [Roseiarcaceae bacterium H3SJ34-1]|uniref:glycosyltransferase family 4 protein n=1 Tax=Terripilifer ovatus TaxID=3032367 RepID=UPI003AB91EEA|nr:glycosyltransferase family 4 protein [Roseiarcaceae bacterium H3SJ34-1]